MSRAEYARHSELTRGYITKLVQKGVLVLYEIDGQWLLDADESDERREQLVRPAIIFRPYDHYPDWPK